MDFDHTHYVPCLRWKMGEYQAVLRLHDTTKKMFTPLIQIPEIGYDFKAKKLKSTIDEHLYEFVSKKIYRKWGTSFCFVDLKLVGLSVRMENGVHPVKYVFDDLREAGCSAVPVTGLDRDKAYHQEIKKILVKDKRSVCFRISIEEAVKSSFGGEIGSLLSSLSVQANNCDFILDLGAPSNFEPLEGLSKLVLSVVNKIPHLGKWQTFTIIGTSFPDSMSEIKIGSTNIPRHEWQLYKILIDSFTKTGIRLPTFGDYATAHPSFQEFDMRKAKPSVKIRYSTDNSFYILKGHNIKDEKFGKNKQYHKLSRKIVASKYFCGSDFSWGDKYIEECANGGKPGYLTTWVEVDTNHHIEKVTQDIANFYAS